MVLTVFEVFPQDQSSLIAIYLRNLQSNLDKNGKTEFTVSEFLNQLPFCTQTLAEPVQRETNSLHQQIADRNIMLEILKKERNEIINQAEKGTNAYMWLLLLVTIAQFGAFYWTIFQVDWLGWDIMEPLTYTVDLLGLLVAMRYYYKHRSVRGLETILKNNRESYINRKPTLKFRFHKLNTNIQGLETERRYLTKSIDFYNSRQKLL